MKRQPITRESILDPEGTHCDRMRAELRDRLDKVSKRGTDGLINAKRAPGYLAGIKATIPLLNRYDPEPREAQAASFNVNAVVLVLSSAASAELASSALPDHARTALQAGGVVLHLDGGNGSG